VAFFFSDLKRKRATFRARRNPRPIPSSPIPIPHRPHNGHSPAK
jgi:hypothetical protein